MEKLYEKPNYRFKWEQKDLLARLYVNTRNISALEQEHEDKLASLKFQRSALLAGLTQMRFLERKS